MPTYIFKMKTKLLIPGLCFCINSLIGHPVFDEQKGCLIDNKFKEINYQKLIDKDFFREISTGNKLKSIVDRLQNLHANMEDSVLNFITEVQTNTSSLKKIKKKTIELDGAIKAVLGKNKISLATAIWLYQVIFAPQSEVAEGNLKTIQTDYDNYLSSLSDKF